MQANKIPVVKVGRAGVAGSPEDFDRHFERKRRTTTGPRIPVRQPKLQPIENKPLAERIEDFGLGER